jgi:pentapeptide MXKDX repeat protein
MREAGFIDGAKPRSLRMRKIGLVVGAIVVGLTVCLAVLGCGLSPSSVKDKMQSEMMGAEKMGGDNMDGDKMGTDKMGTDKMGADKMGADNMGGDPKEKK